jgi:hypothetical protein
MPRFGHAMNTNSNAMPGVATEEHVKLSTANDSSRSAQAQPVVAVGSRSLTQQGQVQLASHAKGRTPGKAQSALPSCQSGAAAAEYGSRYWLPRASARTTAGSLPSSRLQRGAGTARRVLGNPTSSGLPAARPNPSLKLTRYGRLCKPGLRYSVHSLSPGLQSLPTRAA